MVFFREKINLLKEKLPADYGCLSYAGIVAQLILIAQAKDEEMSVCIDGLELLINQFFDIPDTMLIIKTFIDESCEKFKPWVAHRHQTLTSWYGVGKKSNPKGTFLSAKQAAIKNIKSHELYRLLIDGVRHQRENGWLDYAIREMNGLPALFNAFTFALENLSNKKISADLLKNIHQRATTEVLKAASYFLSGWGDTVYETVPDSSFQPGKFRVHSSSYLLSEPFFDEFIKENSIPELCEWVEKYKKYGFCISVKEKGFFSQLKTIEDRDRAIRNLTAFTGSPEELWQKIKDPKYDVRFTTCAPEYLEEFLEEVFQKFNNDIEKIESPSEKLKLIVQTVQMIERAHPFYDGNGRTCLILLQRLLIQNDFLPVMLANPNYIDGYDLKSLIDEVEKGMQNTQQIIDKPGSTLFGHMSKAFVIEEVHLAPENIKSIRNHAAVAMNSFYDTLQSFVVDESIETKSEVSMSCKSFSTSSTESSSFMRTGESLDKQYGGPDFFSERRQQTSSDQSNVDSKFDLEIKSEIKDEALNPYC